MSVACAGQCGREVVPVSADDSIGTSSSMWFCGECYDKALYGSNPYPCGCPYAPCEHYDKPLDGLPTHEEWLEESKPPPRLTLRERVLEFLGK